MTGAISGNSIEPAIVEARGDECGPNPVATPGKPQVGQQPAVSHAPSPLCLDADAAAPAPQPAPPLRPGGAHPPSAMGQSLGGLPPPQPSSPQQPLTGAHHLHPDRNAAANNLTVAPPPASPIGLANVAAAPAAGSAAGEAPGLDHASRSPHAACGVNGTSSGAFRNVGGAAGGAESRPGCGTAVGGSPSPQLRQDSPPGKAQAQPAAARQTEGEPGQRPEDQAGEQEQERGQRPEQGQREQGSSGAQAGDGPGEGPPPQVATQRANGFLSDPDYEVPRGTLTETKVLLSLEQGRQNRPVKVDRYGFVLAVQDDGTDDDVGDCRRDSGAAASTSGGGGAAGADLPARLERLMERQLRLHLRQRRRRRVSQLLDQQFAGRLRKWCKMLGRAGAALEEYRRRRPEKLKRRVRKGVPDPLRGLAWLAISGGRELKEANPGLFAELLSLDGEGAPAPARDAPAAADGAVAPAAAATAGGAGAAVTSPQYAAPVPDVTLCIMRDLNRTFPNNVYFMQRQGPGQKALFSVLWATAAYRPAVGYVQGMGFLAAVLLLYMEAEEAFWTLQAMMQGPAGWSGQGGMERLYTAGMPGLQCCLYQFKHLLREAAPRLAARLEREGVEPELYATHWFNTAFAYTLPFPHLLRVWDVFLAEGPKTLFRVGLAVLQHAEARLLGLRFEALLSALSAKALPALLPPDPGELIGRATRIPVSRRLRGLAEEWQTAAQRGQGPGQRQGQRARG